MDKMDGVGGVGRGDDERDDGLVLEVSDLRAADALRDDGHVEPPRAGPSRAGAARRPGSILASRRVRGTAALALTLLACAAVLLGLPATRPALLGALAGPTPTPTAPLARGADAVNFVGGVPWGRLTTDGRPLDTPRFFVSVTLPRGRHALEYRADPFPPLRCTLTVPAAAGDTCPLSTRFQPVGPGQLDARFVDLGCTPDRLPGDQRAALARAVAAALQASPPTAAVAPGDHYLGADGVPAVAAVPLRATLALALNADPARSHPYGPSNLGPGDRCVDLCVSLGGDGGGPPGQWAFTAHVVARWRFAAPDGTVIAPTGAVPSGAGAGLDAPLEVAARWAGGAWSLDAQPNPASLGQQLCYAAFLVAFPDNNPLHSGTGTITATWATVVSAPDGVGGCVETTGPSPDDAGGPPGGPAPPGATPTPLPADTAVFIARFGMVLAGNDAAHAAQPQLPLASAHERALALGWLRQTP